MVGFRSIGARPDATRGTSAVEVRKGLAGLFAPTDPFGIGGRTGILTARSSIVSGTAGFAYSVGRFHAVTSRGEQDGVHVWGLDEVIELSVSDAGEALAAPGSGLSRVDVIYAQQPSADENGESTSEPVIAVAKGVPGSSPLAPAIPPGATELGRNIMASTATSTSSAGNNIQHTYRWASLRGTPIPVRSAAERDALGGTPALTNPVRVWRRDAGYEEINTGSGWRRVSTNVVMGWAQVSTDPNGRANVSHGLGAAPIGVVCTAYGNTDGGANPPTQIVVSASSASTFTVRIFSQTGVAVSNSSVRVAWSALLP